MTTERGYNGWASYETWAVALWIGNEQGSQEYWEREQAEDCYRAAVEAAPGGERAGWTREAVGELARRLRTELDDEAELPRALDGTVYADLLNAALSEVDWHEIAAAYVEGLDREQIERDAGVGGEGVGSGGEAEGA